MFRLTFSHSLAKLICDTLNDKYAIKRFDCVLGKILDPGEESKSGLYAVISDKGVVLRVQLIKEIAEMYRDDSRIISEAYLKML